MLRSRMRFIKETFMRAIFLICPKSAYPNYLDALTASIRARERNGVKVLNIHRIIPEGDSKIEVVCDVQASFNDVHSLAHEIENDKRFELLPIKILRVR